MRLTKQQRLDILAAMIEEGRRRTAEGLSLIEVQQYVRQVRDDLKSAMQQGVTVQIAPDQGLG